MSAITTKAGVCIDSAPESWAIQKSSAPQRRWEKSRENKLSEKDIKVISRNLVETAPDPVVALFRLFRLRRELRAINTSEKIVSATLNLEVTRLSNKVQKECSEQRENEGIDFPDHFSLESVKERLNLYNVSNISDKLALADIMIMLCIRSAEIKNLRISNRAITGYAKNRDEFIPESGKPLLPSSLRKLDAVFASVAHEPKNASKANTYASEALRHLSDNHASPSKRYTIVNMRKREEPYNQAKVYKVLFGQIWELEKKLEDYYFKYEKLKRRVNLLEAEIEDLDECVNKETL
ncbi:25994_t:CDS:2, partial [Dentiscutata erythropus]